MIRNRIQQYIDYKGISKYKFYKDNGISNGFLDKEGSVRSDICEKISYQYKDLNLVWLITGKGDMILSANMSPNMSPNDEKNIKEAPVIYKLRTDKTIEEQRIPLYDMEAAAGMLPMLQDLDSKEPLDYLYIPNAPACDGAIFATGDSMYPLLKSGDILAFKIIKDIKNNVFWGEMYILYIDVEGDLFRVVKYVQKGKDEQHYRLVSQNKHHQDKEVRIDKIRAMAQVKLSIRMN